MEHLLWSEKYRPTTIDQFAGNEEFISKVKYWIENDCPINMILHSEKSGTGKTTCCKLLAKALDCDLMYINASDENSIDTVREKIKSFATTIGFSRWKVVILDEFSYFTPNAQSALLNIIESTSKTTRFFLTGNYLEKFLPAIISRCTPFLIQSPPPAKIYENMCNILTSEGKTWEKADLVRVIKQYYPDQRSMLNYLQDNSTSGSLVYSVQNLVTNEYCSKILDELKKGSDVKTTFTNIRQIIADARVRQFDDLFKFLFDNLEEFVPDGKRASVILHIAEWQNKANFVLDREIPVAAMFINILRELK